MIGEGERGGGGEERRRDFLEGAILHKLFQLHFFFFLSCDDLV